MTDFYFPKGTWCSLFAPTVGQCLQFNTSQNYTLPSRVNESFVHLREGFILPMQDATGLNAKTTKDLQFHPVDLHILGSYRVPGIMSWTADGDYINDDGVTTVL
jgi:alpha-glucosidase (family GH31 glycosyl hydrolase)